MPDKNAGFSIMYNVILAKSFEYYWLRTLAMFDVARFPDIMSGTEHHFKFCRYVNYVDKFLFIQFLGICLIGMLQGASHHITVKLN